MIRIYITRKNLNTKAFENLFSSKVKLNDSLMYFNSESIKFTDVNQSDDILLVSIGIISKETITKLNPTSIRLKDFICGEEHDEVWTLSSQSLISLKYLISSEEVSVPKFDFDFTKFSSPVKQTNECKKYPSENFSLMNFANKTDQDSPVKITDKARFTQNCVPFKSRRESKEHSLKLISPFIVPIECGSKFTWRNKTYVVLESDIEQTTDYISHLKNEDTKTSPFNSFCEAIFVSGIPKDNSQLINESDGFPSICGHDGCCILPAHTPKLLHKYYKKDFNFGLNDVTAGLCFPLGVKICCSCSYSGELTLINPPRQRKAFMNVVTNENGDRYYMVSQMYFKRVNCKRFDIDYSCNPIRRYLSSDKEEKFTNNLQIISKFIINDEFFIPECITLVSKYPYIKQMSESITSILKLNPTDACKLITHLIHEVPNPELDKNIMLFLPLNPKPIEINHKTQLGILLANFATEDILLIWLLILMEQKLLFVFDDYHTLSSISNAFISLIYPLSWVNTYIPVLSFDMIKYLQSFMPFIMGVDEYLLKLASQYIEDPGHLVVVIKKNSIELNGKKTNKKNILKNLGLFDLPEKIFDEMTKMIRSLKKKMKESPETIDNEMKDAFLKGMVMLVGDFRNFMFELDDKEMPLFNNDAFITNRPKTCKAFYQELITSQIFKQFLMDFSSGQFSLKDADDNFIKFCDKHSKIIYTANNHKIQSPNLHSNKRANSLSTMNRSSIIESAFSYTSKLSNQISMNSTISNTPNILVSNQSSAYFEPIDASHVDSYYIPPYFIENTLDTYDVDKIEKIIKNETANDGLDHFSFIFEYGKDYNFDLISESNKQFAINSSTRKENMFRRSRSLTIASNANDLLDKLDNNEKENIHECIKCLLTSVQINKEVLREVEKSMSQPIGRGVLANILYKKELRDAHKQLNEQSFAEMANLIALTLKKCGVYEVNTSVLLAKSMLCYFKREKKELLYIFQMYQNKMLILFPNFLRKEFWTQWIETEKEENDTNYFTAITYVTEIMMKFKLDKGFISRVLVDKICGKYLTPQECSNVEFNINTTQL